MYITMKELMY